MTIDLSMYNQPPVPGPDIGETLNRLQDVAQVRQLRQQQMQSTGLDIQKQQREAAQAQAVSAAIKNGKTPEDVVANLKAAGVDFNPYLENLAKLDKAGLDRELALHAQGAAKAQDLSDSATKVLSVPEEQQDAVYEQVRQQHPDWPPQRNQAFLTAMTTAKDFNGLQTQLATQAKNKLKATKTQAEIDNLKNPPAKPSSDYEDYKQLYPNEPDRSAAGFVKFKRDQLKPSFQSKDIVGPDGKPSVANYDPATGKYADLQGKDLPNPQPYQRPLAPSAALGNGATSSDPKDIAQAIIDGKQPPVLTGLYRDAAPVRAELARKGYDLATATSDWTATQKNLSSMNSTQQLKLRQAIQFTNETLPQIDTAYAEWKKQAGISGFKILNKANLAAMKQLPGAPGSAATNLDALIGDFTSELGTVYKGGNSSTDESLKLAATNLSGNWNEQTFGDAMTRIHKSLAIRTNSIQQGPQGVTPGSPYTPAVPAATAAPAAGSTTLMTGPRGDWNVPNDQVEVFEQNGYRKK